MSYLRRGPYNLRLFPSLHRPGPASLLPNQNHHSTTRAALSNLHHPLSYQYLLHTAHRMPHHRWAQVQVQVQIKTPRRMPRAGRAIWSLSSSPLAARSYSLQYSYFAAYGNVDDRGEDKSRIQCQVRHCTLRARHRHGGPGKILQTMVVYCRGPGRRRRRP